MVRLFDEWWSYLPAGAVDDLHHDLDISYAGAGWLLALLTLGALAGTPLALLADHVDRRRCAVLGALVIAGCLCTYALGAPFWLLAATTATVGTASDLLVHAVEASVSETDGVRLDKMVAAQHAVSTIGDLAGPALLAIGAATVLGWQGAFAITALAMVGYAAYLWSVPFAPPLAAASGWRDVLGDAATIARRRDVWHLAAVEMLLSPLDEPFLAFAIARSANNGATAWSAQALAVAVMGGGVAGSVVVARIGGGRTTQRASVGAMVAGTALVAVDAAWPATAVGLAGVGFGMAGIWADLHVRILRTVPGRSATVSIVVGTLGSAGALVPVLAGVLADRAGLDAALAVYVAVAVALAVVGMPATALADEHTASPAAADDRN